MDFHNASVAKPTMYESCREMPGVIIWYLCLQFINMFMGIPANIVVIWLIRTNKGDSSTSDIFILQLAVLDVLFCLTPPLELVNILYLTSDLPWYVLRFFYGIKDTSPLFLACICLDRYMAVLHPLTFTELKDRNHRAVLATAVWLVVLAYAAGKCVGSIPDFDRVFTVLILATFAFMVFCNIAILWALWQSGPGRDEMHPVKKRACRMVLIILAIIVFNYFPPVALFPFKVYYTEDVFRCYIHYLAFGLMDFSSSIQPVLYLSKDKLVLSAALCCRGKKKAPVSTSNTTQTAL
ncbi:hypothetical protein NHX12_027728 [Muraenolepis orangiensis]|nr:hypothetical protein NHX12_027728 [Muraenolepis orangiensis]